MDFIQATKSYFIKWNDFKSRSSRSEFWWGTLGINLISIILGFTVGFIFATVGLASDASSDSIEATVNIILIPWYIFTVIAGIAIICRRLHDIDRSGWWYLIFFTVIGAFVLLYWFCKKGTDGKNRFGDNPLEEVSAYSASES